MQTLTCPIPSNLNPLQSNGFRFAIDKLPSVTYFCQDVVLPSLDLPPAEQPTPLSDNALPGDKIQFGDLTITFLVDEQMANYKAIHNWIVGLGFPQSRMQYTSFLKTQPTAGSEAMKGYSDGVLQILSSSNTAVAALSFRDLFPISLGQLLLQTTNSDTVYLAGTATFKYTYYEFV